MHSVDFMPFENSLKAKAKNSKGECWPVEYKSKACNGGKLTNSIVVLVVPVPLALL
jgi:hypothetical protein